MPTTLRTQKSAAATTTMQLQCKCESVLICIYVYVCVSHSFVAVLSKYANTGWTIYITQTVLTWAQILSTTMNRRGCLNNFFSTPHHCYLYYSRGLLSFSVMSGTLHDINTREAVNFALFLVLFWFRFFHMPFLFSFSLCQKPIFLICLQQLYASCDFMLVVVVYKIYIYISTFFLFVKKMETLQT